jgi:predicted RNA binding protein YcfA (HicA-like mRNA interferase family)
MGDGPRVPHVSSDEIAKALCKLGFTWPTQRGATSHVTFHHERDGQRSATLQMGVKDFPQGTLQSVLDQAGVTVSEFLLALGGSHKRAEKLRLKREARR